MPHSEKIPRVEPLDSLRSREEQELVGIEQHAAKGREILLFDQLGAESRLLTVRRATDRQSIGQADLRRRVAPRLALEPGGETRGLLGHEPAVEEVERLQGGRGARSARLVLPGVGTIEG